MSNAIAFPWQQARIIRHSQRLLNSFQHWTGSSLLDLDVNFTPEAVAEKLFAAPFVLVSHGTGADPIFNYGNHQALTQWEMTWEEFTQTPSRKSAEEVEQTERDRLLSEAATKGFCYYSGIRITSTGKRFYIEDGILWNLVDEQHQYCGQAAMYAKSTFIT
ncbi:MEKHLA domain-containing protein [Nostoc sp. FACHB-110]|uniref:MEKHLA domain-containing protein n=1 Tax=Nostoc sp. FACHB-110 TaxID=2692834 RepID=UPI0016884152|nr:MEKHLA domain-containing protein [Nostoc sp. FACHB-110]MBD2440435.1 MEKHLA domain-containing protein [Nostoc sp. FACHB-110]